MGCLAFFEAQPLAANSQIILWETVMPREASSVSSREQALETQRTVTCYQTPLHIGGISSPFVDA
jgi:hypothetical protein